VFVLTSFDWLKDKEVIGNYNSIKDKKYNVKRKMTKGQ
jgi:hypothetical protein